MNKQTPCATCTRGCCHQYTVTITGYDAWVIASGLQLAPEQFLVTIPQKKPNSRGFRLDRGEARYDIALDKAAVESEARPCIFWIGFPNGVGRCGIYQLRPFVCQTYPATLQDGAIVRREDVLCADDAWRGGILERPFWLERLQHMRVEFDIYARAVGRWNTHVLATRRPERISILNYYTYLMNFYGRLEPIRREVGTERWQTLCRDWSACLQDGVSPLSASEKFGKWRETIEAICTVADGFFTADPQPAEVEPTPEEATLLPTTERLPETV